MNATPDLKPAETNLSDAADNSSVASGKPKDWQASVDAAKESQPGRTC